MQEDHLVGYAISDCNQHQVQLAQTLNYLAPFNVIELQPERNLWNVDEALPRIMACPYRGVHAASDNLDLSNPLALRREEAIRKTLASMDLAHLIHAQVLVLHPVNSNAHLSWEERMLHRDIFLQVFQTALVPHYHHGRHAYTICLENLEYPKLPASLEEFIDLFHACSAIHPVGMVLDIPHIWNTRRIIMENPQLQRHFNLGNLERGLVDYVTHFLSHYQPYIKMFHLANFGTHPVRTHDPVTRGEIHPDLRVLLPLLRERPIILEVYTGPISGLKDSQEVVAELVQHAHGSILPAKTDPRLSS